MATLFTGGRVFDGSGSAAVPQDILVEGDRIVSITAPGQTQASPQDQVIDCAGATVMPGLIESHAHLSWPSSVERIIPSFELPLEEGLLISARNARVLLDHGFTAAYSGGANSMRCDVVIRNEQAAGWIPGPRLRACSIEQAPIGNDNPFTRDLPEGSVGDPEGIAAFIRRAAELGLDSAKMLLSGESALVPGSSDNLLYTQEELDAAGKAAKEAGIWLVGHAYSPAAVIGGVNAGFRILYHCTFADDEALDALESRKDEMFVAPGIGIHVATLEAKPPPGAPNMDGMKRNAEAVIEALIKVTPKMRERGIRILPGGDYGFPFNPNGRNARDIQHFVDLLGYSPADALASATRLGGELMDMEIGLLKPGYLADILVVNGDVTADVSLLQDKTNLRAIMQGGKLYKGAVRQLAAA